MLPLIIGIDGSEQARHALVWGLDHAAAAGLPVTVTTAVETPDVVGRAALYDQLEWYRNRIERAQTWLRDEVDALGPPPSLPIDVAAADGHPVDVLVAASQHASAVVVGARGLGAFRRTMLGSVSTGLAHHAHAPVVVVREDAPVPAPNPDVVVGFDGSEAAGAALAWANGFVQAHNGRLTIVQAWDWPTVQGAPVTLTSWDPRQVAKDAVERAAAETGLPDGRVRTVVGKGGAAGVLLEQSTDADLLVVGSRGLGGFAGIVIGSVSNHCLHHATCTVAIVRTG